MFPHPISCHGYAFQKQNYVSISKVFIQLSVTTTVQLESCLLCCEVFPNPLVGVNKRRKSSPVKNSPRLILRQWLVHAGAALTEAFRPKQQHTYRPAHVDQWEGGNCASSRLHPSLVTGQHTNGRVDVRPQHLATLLNAKYHPNNLTDSSGNKTQCVQTGGTGFEFQITFRCPDLKPVTKKKKSAATERSTVERTSYNKNPH